ncbi:tRNA (cytidine(34)-2'-O)-methyltransferase [Pricia sp. S334]|uniref:Putative tRNA (cytidine(34)-2'-O)-methyltransferase n=1 Tax=Pricia mediterranea TaxID=3076079 RepID=A0ABU3L2J5_9FLAO|nr:tRNA (cytidine(34)-2'-O)-methyltransferase [Pricia sp. S334]MDT7827969.1 tRNA (cytidine(34)-2'-O)-methyltransferase [Pricia sp. S334]
MALHIVLVEPEIPNNTGNIGRLALATGSHLHLIKPFGFELSDKRLKRAGLDYWQHLSVSVYENTDEFFGTHRDKKMAFFSSHGVRNYWSLDFTDGLFLIFGKEASGLAPEIAKEYEDRLFKIPMFSEHIRSLNLANAVGIVVYEGLRQFALP